MLQDDQRDAVLEQMAVIYPRALDEVEPETLARAREEYAKSVQKLLREQQQGAAEGERQLDEAEMLLLVLKIAFSSFMGGIYVAGAMFNHDCRPNLISQPRPNGAPGTCMMATRAVAAGQELTFSYLSPLEQSSTQRSKKFEFQHLCQLGSSPWPQVRRLCAALCARLAARDCWRWRCAGESGGAPNPSRARLLPARISRRWRPFLQNWSA